MEQLEIEENALLLFMQILMDTGAKKSTKIFSSVICCTEIFWKEVIFQTDWQKRRHFKLNKKIQAYDVIICDVYICNEQLSSTAKNLNCIKLAQNAADYY